MADGSACQSGSGQLMHLKNRVRRYFSPVIELVATRRFAYICLAALFLGIMTIFHYESRRNGMARGREMMSARSLDDTDVTYATHLSIDRLPALAKVLERWTGPVAVAFYLQDIPRDFTLLQQFIDEHALSTRMIYCTYSSNDPASKYPVNILRNRVLRIVRTSLVFLVDADFVPDSGLYGYLVENIDFLHQHADDTVFVVPAFEFLTADAAVPDSQREAWTMMEETKEIQPILADRMPWTHAHSINYYMWFRKTEPYYAVYRELWEPYFVMHTTKSPPFDERFIYYGNDKVQQIHHMFHRGYKFLVLPFHFIVHQDHDPATWSTKEERSPIFQKMIAEFEKFKAELEIQEPRSYFG